MKYIAFTFVFIASLLCSCNGNKAASEREQTRPEVKTDVAQPSDVQTGDTLRTITKEMAYEGVNNYCHKEYDWSVAKDNPDIMYVQMDEETDSTYQVVFRSYTGAFVHFYVNKTSGTTRMVEKVPNLNIEEDDGEHQSSAGTINLFDYLDEKNERSHALSGFR